MVNEVAGDDLREIAREAAREAVKELLIALGIDAKEPLEMQEDFAWLRRYRKMSEKVGSRVLITLITIFVGGGAAAIWTKFKF
jgi:hypothetical protein